KSREGVAPRYTPRPVGEAGAGRVPRRREERHEGAGPAVPRRRDRSGDSGDDLVMADETTVTLSRKDFQTDQEVRWCPGCGDYSILANVQLLLAELGVRPENLVFVSGIGCAARFPYYMETYGIHSIHGR